MNIQTKILSFLLFSLVSTQIFAKPELLFSIDLIRHGDRTPIHEIPKFNLYWQEGLGALTEKGMHQEKKLGEQLRIQYIIQDQLLPKIYNPTTMYVYSTNKDRTIQSADSLLSGLYPPKTRELNQQIPVHVLSDSNNFLVVQPSKNIFSLIKRYIVHYKLWHEKTADLQDKLQQWSQATGMPLDDFEEVGQLADNLYIRQLKHFPLPKGISNSDADEIISLGRFGIINAFKLKEVTDPMGKRFLKTVNNYLKLAIEQKTSLKYVLLSGHDGSIMTVMNTLGSPMDLLPDYAARLNFSLIKDNNKYYIKITYNNTPVNIPACLGTTCTLSQWDKLLKFN